MHLSHVKQPRQRAPVMLSCHACVSLVGTKRTVWCHNCTAALAAVQDVWSARDAYTSVAMCVIDSEIINKATTAAPKVLSMSIYDRSCTAKPAYFEQQRQKQDPSGLVQVSKQEAQFALTDQLIHSIIQSDNIVDRSFSSCTVPTCPALYI